MNSFSELYKLGGMQLVMSIAFIVFMWRMIKYFITQIQETRENGKALQVQFIAERDGAHKLFNDALKSNNEQVAEWLEKLATSLQKQEAAFQELIILIKTQAN